MLTMRSYIVNQEKLQQALDHLYQAASLANQADFKIPEINDLIEILEQETVE